jgi:hypothetical protein
MKKATNIILIVIGLMPLVIFKEISKEKINENAIENILKENKTTTLGKDSISEISYQDWFFNTQFGLVFETPKAMKETNMEIPQGAGDYVNRIYSYILNDGQMAINYLIMETKFKTYDTKEGLRGSVGNLINTGNGTNLNLTFFKTNSNYNDQNCEGAFYYKNLRMYVRGFCLFNEKGRVYIIIACGANDEATISKIKRVFGSIKVMN